MGEITVYRRQSSLESYGYPLFTGWETLSGSATFLYGEEVTGGQIFHTMYERGVLTFDTFSRWLGVQSPVETVDSVIEDGGYSTSTNEDVGGGFSLRISGAAHG